MALKTEPTSMDQNGDETHPAFAVIGASRVSSSPPGSVLFDSDITHQHSVIVRIKAASRKRDLNQDWIHGESELIEVQLSEAQWASFVSSMNSGDGVPATIRARDGQMVPGLPYEPRMAHSMREVKEAAAKMMENVKEAMDAYETALAERAPAKVRNEALRKLRAAVANSESNVSFAAKSLTEYTEGVVQRARADIEAMVGTEAARLGLTGEQAKMVALPSMPSQPLDD